MFGTNDTNGQRSLGGCVSASSRARIWRVGLLGMLAGICLLGSATQGSPETEVTSAPEPKSDSAVADGVDNDEGWGTLSGRFVYDGIRPELGFVAVCGEQDDLQNRHHVPDESLVIDPTTKGIKNIVVYARKVSRVHESYDRFAEVWLVQGHCRFEPHVLSLQTSQTLRIKNLSPMNQICLMRPPRRSWETNVLLRPGDDTVTSFVLQEYKPVPVTSVFHPWMKAYVLPRRNPYFAVTDEYGSFHIANLPAGNEIEFQVWHEQAKQAGGSFVAKPEWANGRFRTVIVKNTVKDLGEIKVSPSEFDIPRSRMTRKAGAAAR